MRRRLLQVLLAGLAGGGIAGAHALAYLLARPVASQRHELLASTGHAHSGVLLTTFLALGFAALVAAAAVRAGMSEPVAPRPPTWIRLAGIQLSGFMVLEAFERVLSGADVVALLREPVMVLGLLAQVAVAALAAVVLRTLSGALRKLLDGGRLVRFARGAQLRWLLPPPLVRGGRSGRGSSDPRAPPTLAVFSH